MAKEKGTGVKDPEAKKEDAVDIEKLRAEIRAEILKEELPALKEELKAELTLAMQEETSILAANLRNALKDDLQTEVAETVQDMEKTKADLRAQTKYRITVHEQDNTDDKNQVFVSVNGYPYLIRRGEEVEVPEGVLNVLREAVIGKISKDKDGNEVIKSVNRFAYTVHGEVKK